MTRCPECGGNLATVGVKMTKDNIKYRRKRCKCGYGISEWSDGRMKVLGRGKAKRGREVNMEPIKVVEDAIRDNPDCTTMQIQAATGLGWSAVNQAIFTMTTMVGIYESDDRPIRYGIDDEIFGTISGIEDIHISRIRGRC